jgi:signal transduction histidine kinase
MSRPETSFSPSEPSLQVESDRTGPPAGPPAPARSGSRAPLVRLALGLSLSLLTIIGFCLYAAHEIGRLRDEQMALSERNRRDSLQLIRVQNNLSTLAVTLRDMMERAEPYPMAAWASTFRRLRVDLSEALELERALAPARPAAQQQQLADTATRFWEAVERALALAERGDEAAAIEAVRTSALPRHAELTSLVSQLLVRNTQVEEEAAAAARDVYTRVIREIYWLMAILAAAVAVAGILNIAATRRAFEEVRALSGQLRALTWRMLRLQEDVQTATARELHDEFGQILTAMTMLLGRVKGKAAAGGPGSFASVGSGTSVPVGHGSSARDSGVPASSTPVNQPLDDAALVRDLEEVHTIARDTLERIRTQSRLLHPVILDDFGVDQALAWYVDQFSRQHGIAATFTSTGLGVPSRPDRLAEASASGRSADDLSFRGQLPPEVAIHVYRIVQEALSNVSRHAGASRAWVRLTRNGTVLSLEIEDDGRGLPQWRAGDTRSVEVRGHASGPAGIGITSMRERAELVGGELTLTRGAAGGLLIRCTIPLAGQRTRPSP